MTSGYYFKIYTSHIEGKCRGDKCCYTYRNLALFAPRGTMAFVLTFYSAFRPSALSLQQNDSLGKGQAFIMSLFSIYLGWSDPPPTPPPLESECTSKKEPWQLNKPCTICFSPCVKWLCSADPVGPFRSLPKMRKALQIRQDPHLFLMWKQLQCWQLRWQMKQNYPSGHEGKKSMSELWEQDSGKRVFSSPSVLSANTSCVKLMSAQAEHLYLIILSC